MGQVILWRNIHMVFFQLFNHSIALMNYQGVNVLSAILQEKGLTCTVCAPFRAQTCHQRRHMVSQRTLTFPVYRCHPPTLSQDLWFETTLVIAFGSCLDELCHAQSSCMQQSEVLQFRKLLCPDNIRFFAWTISDEVSASSQLSSPQSGRHFPWR